MGADNRGLLRRVGRAAAVTGAVGAAGLAYASVIERNWFRLRRYELPLLPPGSPRLRILHLSDAHLTPGRRMLIDWIRGLDAYEPDLVVNTGDSLAHPDAVGPFTEALGPLLERPGAFVYGSNDLFSPQLKNPARYLWRTSKDDYGKRRVPDLPWRELGAAMSASGWLDLNNRRGELRAGGLDVALAGVHDSHIKLDRYEEVAGPADPSAALRLGVLHSPEPSNLDRFTADGYQLLLAGHTHGGQLCLPFYGTLVTNCGIDRRRAWGLHGYGDAWLHVSGGLGTSPYAPVRFCCRPEASLLDIVAAS
ncbi:MULTISPECIES: metallophosphoesterase [Nocardiopsis]|uniref:Metallophosphoesterase n=1 Tax=Nocardiopsis sinuspersici TaxID=501010 RepID=A0A1V3C5J4_9ACTN|nr:MULTISPECIES: metallophosphoesterase [Nocardiopsis]NYH52587.1 putative MPP superfamily phosphohydrolase [Nocardiopsis sinuspersici]OOC56051.1 metallophosphoesterase [Nocardiopsis sinuspersici]